MISMMTQITSLKQVLHRLPTPTDTPMDTLMDFLGLLIVAHLAEEEWECLMVEACLSMIRALEWEAVSEEDLIVSVLVLVWEWEWA